MPTHAELIAAVQSGDAAKVRSLLHDDPSLAATKDANGVSAVMHAFYCRRLEIADLLIAAKPELDIFEATAAGNAARMPCQSCSRRGSSRRDSFAAAAVASSAAHAMPTIAATFSVPGRRSPFRAAAHGTEIVRLLLENDAPADARQHGGWTALHEAAQIGDTHMVRDLLQHGADPQARSDDGKTPADMATAKGHEEILKLLSR